MIDIFSSLSYNQNNRSGARLAGYVHKDVKTVGNGVTI